MSALVHIITVQLPGGVEDRLRTLVAKRRAATGYPPTSEVRSAICTELTTQMLQQKSGVETIEMKVAEVLARHMIEEQGNWTGPATVLQLSVEAEEQLKAIIGRRSQRSHPRPPTEEESAVALEVEHRKDAAAARQYLRYTTGGNTFMADGAVYTLRKSRIGICTELITQALRSL